jgi:dethiobiotin synthetase
VQKTLPEPHTQAAEYPSAKQGVVILATDTGVGKTTIGCALTQTLHQRGRVVQVRKPVETGCATDGDSLIPEDATRLWAAAGEIESIETVCPLRFTTPVAAPQAARIEGRHLQFERDIAPILSPARRDENGSLPFWIIESAGGALSPLTDDALNCELASFSKLPAMLIAPDRLGTLSTLFAHIESLVQRRVPIAAIVLNQHTGHSPAENHQSPDNLHALEDWLPRLWPDGYQTWQGDLPPVISVGSGENTDSIGQKLISALKLEENHLSGEQR